MTTPLPEAQAQFHDFVINGGPAPVAITRSTEKASAEKLLGVYLNGYRLTMLEAIGEDFPGLKILLGEAGFQALGRDYIAQEKSRHYSIRWYGAEMAAFLTDNPAWRERPELAAMAAWEWALGEAADAADGETIEAGAFAEIPPEDWAGLTFAFHPSLRRLDLLFSVPQFRQAVDDGETEATPPEAPEALDVPVAWAIWRQGTDILYRSLAEGEPEALKAARDGASFGTLCEGLASSQGEENAAQTAAGFLRTWVEQNWITGVEA